MSEHSNASDRASRRPVSDDELEGLLREAGMRPPLPESDLTRIRAAAREEWERVSGVSRASREVWRSRPALALAASVLVVALVAWWWWTRDGASPAAEVIATIETVTGGRTGELVPGRGLTAGTELRTGGGPEGRPGRLAIRWAGGQSIRLDVGTTVRLGSVSRLELTRGAVYVDSGATGSQRPLEVDTALGSIREIGTQFEVRVIEGEGPLRVRVREGDVLIDARAAALEAAAGQQVSLGRDGSVERQQLEAFGDEWGWILDVAPGFDIEGRTVATYLTWVSRETGLRVRFVDRELETVVEQTVLHGSLEGLRPDQTLDLVLPGSGVAYRIDGGRLEVFRQ